jgi:hypothetical protein
LNDKDDLVFFVSVAERTNANMKAYLTKILRLIYFTHNRLLMYHA